MNATDDLFKRVKFESGGMLSPNVYAEIARYAADATTSIVEIGTATGAATLALALGSPPEARIHTVDPMNHPDWLTRFRSPENMRAHVVGLFNSFNCESKIHHYYEYPFGPTLPDTQDFMFDGALIDADGALDRDFNLLYDALKPGAFIIIDDFKPEYVRFFKLGGGRARVDQKHRLSSLFIECFEEAGLIHRENVVEDTWFGRKADSGRTFADVDQQEVLKIYRKLTFAHGVVVSQASHALRKKVKAEAPTLYQLLYNIRGKVKR